MNNSMIAAKKVLRNNLKIILQSISENDRATRSKLLIQKLINTPQFVNSKRVALYLSMPDEVDMSDLLCHIFSKNKLCFIPQYEKDEMRMLQLFSITDYDTLPVTKWNIKQPDISDTARPNALTSGGLDLVVVPGLGFTKCGKRLGRGKGYYDRFMKEAVNSNKQHGFAVPYFVAVAFREQIIDDIPVTENDFIIDEVIIE